MRRFALGHRRIGLQIGVLTVISVLLAHVVTLAGLVLAAGLLQAPTGPAPFDGGLAVAGRLIDGASPAEQARLLAALARELPGVRLDPATRARDMQPGPVGSPARHLMPRPGEWPRVGVTLADGRVLSAPEPPPPGLPWPLIGVALALACTLGLLSVWAARSLVAPLARLEGAVAGADLTAPSAVPVEGPHEVRRLAQTFNAMRGRLQRMVDDRTFMVAAVGHDLQTPITRLTLKTETIPDRALRHTMLQDLALMQRMVRSALDYLACQTAPAPLQATVDLPALLQMLCDDFSDMTGVQIGYRGPQRLVVLCDADRVARAIGNLIDNAARHGGATQVRLEQPGPGLVAVVVEDCGPGIPSGDLDQVLAPFRRGNAARTLGDRVGFGLGLTIAESVARAHGGQLLLANRATGGLRATFLMSADLPGQAATA